MSQYCTKIYISKCRGLSNMIPYYALGQMQKLQRLEIDSCNDMKEVFETQGINNDNNIDDVNGGTPAIRRPNDVILLKLSNLKFLRISSCHSLEYIFTFSALESLKQLEELLIDGCRRMKVIVKEENDGEQPTLSSSKVMVFPCLKSIKLVDLVDLVSFFLGMNEFRWPLLDKVTISGCPHMTSFTHGESKTPKLKYIHTRLGKHILEPAGLNFCVKTTSYLQPPILQRVDHTSLFPGPAKGMPWSFHNLIELIYVRYNHVHEKIIPCSELLQLQKLEQICVIKCEKVEEVFETMEGRYRGFDSKSQTTVVNLPNLRQVKLKRLEGLRYIWKSNQGTIFEFPNLTRVSIKECQKLEHVITSSMVGSLLQLQELKVGYCDLVEEVFEALKGTHSTGSDELQSTVVKLPNLRQVKLVSLKSLRYLWKSNQWTVFEFQNLTRLEIIGCKSLQHVFTCYMAGSLLQLQELHISRCDKIEAVIVKDANGAVEEEEESDAKMNEIVLPRLKSLILKNLACFKGLCLENVDFSFPLLETLKMKRCPTIKIFTKGSSATPELKVIKTGFGSFFAGEINSFVELKQEEFKLDAESDDEEQCSVFL